VFRHVVLHRNCAEKPAEHLAAVLGYVMSVCLYVYSNELTYCEGRWYFDSATEFKIKNLYSAFCYDLVGRMLQL
jgi:hypothetical protein